MENLLQGTIFIPDISGYTRFVSEIDPQAGAQIVSKLLQSMIDANDLDFRIAEVEGDAVLFYKFGPAYPVNEILLQFRKVLNAFNQTLGALSIEYPIVNRLSVKLIVHYGPMQTLSVSGFSKLYGKALIEAHRLLKNNIRSHTYVLITEDYAKAAQHQLAQWPSPAHQCERLEGIGKICYTFFTYKNHMQAQHHYKNLSGLNTA